MFGDSFINTLRGVKGSITPTQPINEAAKKGKALAPLLGITTGRRSTPYNKVYGFESDANMYADLPANNPAAMDKLAWSDYTVVSNDGSGNSRSFSVGYDDSGRIAAVRQDIDVNGSPRRMFSVGRKNLKDFFSGFDRDATDYRVWQERSLGNDNNEAWVVFDSKRDNSPFIPSQIFRGTPRTLQPATPLPRIPVQDTFTGNLRSTNPGVSSGLNGLR